MIYLVDRVQVAPVTGDNGLGLGLFGYACPGPDYFLADGISRLALLDLREAADAERAGWRSVPGVTRAAELRYRIEPGWGYGAARP